MVSIQLADDTIELFEDFTKLDIQTYISDFTDFIDNNLINFVNFYKGTAKEVDAVSMNKYLSLYKRCNDISNTTRQVIQNFTRNDFAYLFLMLDEIKTKIYVINKLSIFLRSSKVNASSNNSLTTYKTFHNFETPESLSTDKNDIQNSWTKTFIQNRVYQTDYTENNGIVLEQEISELNNLFLNNVVDNLNYDNLLGKDLDKNIVYDIATSDFVALGFTETFTQGVQILGTMMQGDNVLYPYLGQNPVNLSGNDYAYNLPFIIRDLQKTLSVDETIKYLDVEDIQVDGSIINITGSCTTIQNSILSQNIPIKQ